jgi:hypothetical protein
MKFKLKCNICNQKINIFSYGNKISNIIHEIKLFILDDNEKLDYINNNLILEGSIINIIPGYGSIFDGQSIKLVICDRCLSKFV